MHPIIRTLRPHQWTKNAIVPAAFFFGYWDPSQSVRRHPLSSLALVATATALFCLISSGIYVLNDIRDRDADRQHPLKRYRPVAAGELSVRLAWRLSLYLLSGALTFGAALALALDNKFIVAPIMYVALQSLYCFGFKHVALVDVLMIATGFVLRALTGALAADVTISPWMLICTFFLALFLALCKRRHEKAATADTGDMAQRPSLVRYDCHLLDQLIAVTASCTVLAYAIYTLSWETVSKFGTQQLVLTVPFVIFGVFRYLDLLYRHNQGDRPEVVLMTDRPLIVNGVLYVLTATLILALR